MSKTDNSGAPKSDKERYYTPYLHAAEMKYNIPSGVLVNMARVESSFNPLAVGPNTKYGPAKGIMQLIPFFHPNVDPFNAPAAIDYAGKYLAQLYGILGDWKKAVAAYNWGVGNVKQHWPTLPTETQNYIKKVFG